MYELAALGGVLIAAVLLVHARSKSIIAFIDQNPIQGVCLFHILNVLDAPKTCSRRSRSSASSCRWIY